ncbi:MAG: hypothetical protein FJ373_04170, partial [Pelagibacterales bacterium]|nr:hypothetical protein [Pelagibacterales bacterium]
STYPKALCFHQFCKFCILNLTKNVLH